MHFVGRFDESRLTPADPKHQAHSEGYSIPSLIDPTAGSVHTELTVNQLDPRGTISPHVHRYERKSPDLKNLKGSMLAHFDMSQIPRMAERQDVMKGLEGVFLNWLIDSKFGASHHRMASIEYQPGVGIGPHDHTLEESYIVFSGEIEGVLDGQPHLAKAGDFLWAGVGCVHSFQNKSAKPVRWLETFSPQPPAENVFRFMADWQKRAVEIEG